MFSLCSGVHKLITLFNKKRKYQGRISTEKEGLRIAQAFEAKELFGNPVSKISADLDVSEPRVYQLIVRAKAIGREYRKE